MRRRVGLALGGGGARGLAHVAVLEALDELNVDLHAITGCSMGAIMGALYASGHSGKEIRSLVSQLTIAEGEPISEVWAKRDTLWKWTQAFRPEFGACGMVKADRLLEALFAPLLATEFSALDFPLTVVATDYCAGTEVQLSEGPLLPALCASMAIPGIFAPHVAQDGRLLVDGGLVNELPYDLLPADTDIRIAVDVGNTFGTRETENDPKPTSLDVMFTAVDILQNQLKRLRREVDPPELLLEPHLEGIKILDFGRIEEITGRGALDPEIVRREIHALLNGDGE